MLAEQEAIRRRRAEERRNNKLKKEENAEQEDVALNPENDKGGLKLGLQIDSDEEIIEDGEEEVEPSEEEEEDVEASEEDDNMEYEDEDLEDEDTDEEMDNSSSSEWEGIQSSSEAEAEEGLISDIDMLTELNTSRNSAPLAQLKAMNRADLLIFVLDARAPDISRSPELEAWALKKGKEGMFVLNRAGIIYGKSG